LLATLARGRYFMPLYPCVAVLVGLVIERSIGPESVAFLRRGWQAFLTSWGIVIVPAGIFVLVVSCATLTPLPQIELSTSFAMLIAAAGLVLGGSLLWCGRKVKPTTAALAVFALAAFAGLVEVGVLTNVKCQNMNPLHQQVLAAKEKLPVMPGLVSLGPV